MRRRAAAGLTILAALAAAPPSTAAPGLELEGTQFRVSVADGHILRQDELPGVRIAFGDGSGRQRAIRIDAVEHDPKDLSGEIMLYALSEQDPASGEWRNLCLPDRDGKQLGFALPGAFTADGRYDLRPNGS